MRVVLDGIIYEKQGHGGTTHMFSEILPRMHRIDPDLHLIALVSGSLKRDLPDYDHIGF
jgi:hypothetical protein